MLFGFKHSDYEGNEFWLPATFMIMPDLTVPHARYNQAMPLFYNVLSVASEVSFPLPFVGTVPIGTYNNLIPFLKIGHLLP